MKRNPQNGGRASVEVPGSGAESLEEEYTRRAKEFYSTMKGRKDYEARREALWIEEAEEKL